MAYTIYCVTNKRNMKRYVGVTKNSVSTRWASHLHSSRHGSMSAFHCAIRKYGEDAWEISELARYDNEEKANDAECLFIAELGTQSPAGYNLTPGGKSRFGAGRRSHSNETRKRMSSSQKRRWAAASDETHELLSEKVSAGMRTSWERRRTRGDAKFGPIPDSRRQKLSLALKASWARRKQQEADRSSTCLLLPDDY